MKTERVIRIRPRLQIFKGMASLSSFFCVFFILLIFFMIGTNFVPVQGRQVQLPEAMTKVTYASRNLVVTVDKDGNVYFNDCLVKDMESLKGQISEKLSGSSAKRTDRERLILRYDVNAGVQTLVELTSLSEELGLDALLMVSKPEQAGKTNFTDFVQ